LCKFVFKYIENLFRRQYTENGILKIGKNDYTASYYIGDAN